MATYPLPENFVDGDILSASDVNALNEGVNDFVYGQFNAQTGTTYTLALTDTAKIVSLTNASPITLTIPTNATIAFPLGSQVALYQGGAGQVTVGGAGVTIRSEGNRLKLSAQYAFASLVKVGTDEWILFGNLAS